MTARDALRPALTLSGKPMSTPLHDVRAFSRTLVGHFIDNVVPCATLPGEAIDGDVTAITRICLELAVSMLDGQDIPKKTDKLAAAAAGWAREGVPIDTILQAIHEGVGVGVDLIMSQSTGEDHDSVVSAARLVVEILRTLTSTVSHAYIREHKAVVSEHHSAVHTLASALLGGYPTSLMARECGIDIAASYSVLAVSIPAHPEERSPLVDATVVARRKLRRVQAELAVRCRGESLALLSVHGGTLMVPNPPTAGLDLEALLAALSAAAQTPITAAVVSTPSIDIPNAAKRAHELLDMVQRLECVPGLYRFSEMALEYQLTRPGPGRERLSSVLDPLDEHPELLETLRLHISNNVNRQRTARMLNIHTNTVDYRLKRIGYITGHDATQTAGLWYLRSALVARSFR
ncbi:PucR family transcriptional regulator [Nocardia callitridis]|uniref:Helix-turn-helix domain-containing protein n=1 Tax=Nocardia callitridis TaxID=648753 RepID=A0ABP9L5U3_9NOCA